jgi:hypothetical protein
LIQITRQIRRVALSNDAVLIWVIPVPPEVVIVTVG